VAYLQAATPTSFPTGNPAGIRRRPLPAIGKDAGVVSKNVGCWCPKVQMSSTRSLAKQDPLLRIRRMVPGCKGSGCVHKSKPRLCRKCHVDLADILTEFRTNASPSRTPTPFTTALRRPPKSWNSTICCMPTAILW